MPHLARLLDFQICVEVVRGDEPWWYALRSDRERLGSFFAQVISIRSVSELRYSASTRKPRVEVQVTVRQGTAYEFLARDIRASVRAIAESLTSIRDAEEDDRPTPMRPPPMPQMETK